MCHSHRKRNHGNGFLIFNEQLTLFILEVLTGKEHWHGYQKPSPFFTMPSYKGEGIIRIEQEKLSRRNPS